MKSLFYALCAVFIFTACQQAPSQYTENSPEIDQAKAQIKAYLDGDWDAWASIYSDTAMIRHNTVEPTTPAAISKTFQESIAGLSSYSFDDEFDFEFVTTDDGEQWVSWWGVWKGTMKGADKEMVIPVHVSQKYVNGKVVSEWGYWDNAPMALAAMEMQMAKEAEEAAESE